MYIPMRIRSNFDRVFYCIAIFLTFVTASGWIVPGADYADDWCYRYCVPEPAAGREFWFVTEAPVTTFGDALTSMLNHFLYVNGRLANLLAFPLLNFTPRPLLMLFCAGAIALMLWMIYVCSLHGRRRPLLWTASGVFLLWTALPWFEYMQSFIFQINYVPPSVLMLAVVSLSRRGSMLHGRRFVWLALLTFVAGWWHEGFAIPLGMALFIAALLRPHRRGARMLLVAILVLAVVTALLSGTASRLEHNISNILMIRYQFFRVLISLWPLALALAVMALCRLRCERLLWKSFFRRVLPLYVAAVAWIPCALIVSSTYRALWPSYLFSVVVIMDGLAVLLRRKPARLPSRAGMLAATVAVAIYVLWGADLTSQAIDSGRRLRALFAAAESAPREDGVIFADICMNEQMPWWNLGMTGESAVMESFGNMTFASRFGYRPERVMILPARLRGKTFDQWPAVSADGSIRGVYPLYASRRNFKSDSNWYVEAHVVGDGYITHRRLLDIVFEKLVRAGIGSKQADSFKINMDVDTLLMNGEKFNILFMTRLPRSSGGRLHYSIEIPDSLTQPE